MSEARLRLIRALCAASVIVAIHASASVVGLWNFNSAVPDANVATGTTSPATGNGAASLVGGTTATFATGDTVADTAPAADNSGWNTTAYPAIGSNPKTAGINFTFSTAGRSGIVISWSQRVSGTASRYARLQYTTNNGATFIDFPTGVVMNSINTYEPQSFDLTALPGVDNNATFGFRIVTEFSPGGSTYAVAPGGTTYGSGGTIRFDMVAVSVASSGAIPQYLGNGNASFGGAIGNGSLAISNNATTIFGNLYRGNGSFNDVLVIYLDTGAGGFIDSSGFGDASDGLRKAISGIDGGGNRSLLTFSNATSSFKPSFAIALGPVSDGFGGLYRLTNGGNNSLVFVSSVNLSPIGDPTSMRYAFSFNLSQIALPAYAGNSFRLLGTYVSNTGYRSAEALPGNVAGTAGWTPFGTISVSSYSLTSPASPLVDIGLRLFDGFSIIKIGAAAGAATSPYRMLKNGLPYGIVLVDPTAANASRIRVQTSAGTKAWTKLP